MGNDFCTVGGHDVALIRIPKCASRSMAAALGLDRPGHHSSSTMLDLSGKVVVSCVRHPLDRLVSWHHFHSNTEPQLYGGRGAYAFREWVADGCPHRFHMRHWTEHPMEQWRWLVDAGKLVKLLRFESLEEDWMLLSGILGGLPPLPRLNANPHGDWRTYYDDQTLIRALAIVGQDMYKFGYSPP